MSPAADQGPGERREVRLELREIGPLSSILNPSLQIFSQASAGSILIKAIVLVVGAPAVGVGLYWYLTFPDVVTLAKSNPGSTAFIESRKTEPKRVRAVKPIWVWMPLSRISPNLQRAVIVSEDASFYRHRGFDWQGIRDAATRNWDRGALHSGGSTITQQLAKNLYLSPEKNLMRKIHEALITRALEDRLTKKRILELYLNVVEWGRGIYGAEAAARHHFGKAARDLSPAEAALLAAILPSPRRHDPLRVTPYLIKRQEQILRRMQDGTIHVNDVYYP